MKPTSKSNLSYNLSGGKSTLSDLYFKMSKFLLAKSPDLVWQFSAK